MKLKSLLPLMGLILLSQFLFAVFSIAAQAIAPPQYVNTRGLDGFNYFFMKHLVGDVDEMLKQQGIDSPVCTFRPQDGSEDLSYHGLGKCLMKNFLSAMQTDEKPGVIYAWIRDSRGRFHSTEIHWRPPLGGWGNLARQVYEMKLEEVLFLARQKLKDQASAERINFKEFIVGELHIILPDDPTALETLSLGGNVVVSHYLRNLKSLSVKLNTTSRPQGQMIYSGPVILNMKSSDTEAAKKFNIQLTTNMNIMLMKRPFYIKSSIVTDGAEFFENGAKP